MGRLKVPAELARKRGNPRNVGVKKLEAPVAEAEAIATLAAPARMSAAAKAVWDKLLEAPVLQLALKGSDAFMFERYCTCAAEWIIFTEALADRRAKTGMRITQTVKRKYGTFTKTRPEYSLRAQCEVNLRAMERDMGLNPVARTALYAKLSEVGDPTKPLPSSKSKAAGADGGDPALPPAPASPIGLLANRKTSH